MKIAASQLRRIIAEEARKAMKAEGIGWDPGQSSSMSQVQTLIGDLVRAAKAAGIDRSDLVDEVAAQFDEV